LHLCLALSVSGARLRPNAPSTSLIKEEGQLGLAALEEHSLRTERCLQLAPNEAMVIRAVGQQFGKGSFLVAYAEDAHEPEDDSALRMLFEALLDDCSEKNATGNNKTNATSPPWLVDVGVHESSVTALASSLGCGVAAFDPEENGVKALQTTRCINAPTRPFAIFPAIAAEATSRSVSSLTLDSVFMPSRGAAANMSVGKIALLKVAMRRCCGEGAALSALQGAKNILESGRVRCLATEMVLDKSTAAFVDFLQQLEGHGYALLHAGPLALPGLQLTANGARQLFRTDSKQLRELYDTFKRIRQFDERSGFRVYGDGLSLDHDGQYFDYTNLVVACRGPLPDRLPVKEKAPLRFRGGRWWLEGMLKP